MNLFFIEKYIQRIRKEDIYNYAKSEGLNLTSNELNTIYTYLETHYKTFLRNKETRIKLLEDLKNKVSLSTANKIDQLYDQYKDKI